jgi:hypothetical protein
MVSLFKKFAMSVEVSTLEQYGFSSSEREKIVDSAFGQLSPKLQISMFLNVNLFRTRQMLSALWTRLFSCGGQTNIFGLLL